MPSFKTICDSINQTAPFLFLSLLLATNGLHYYVIRNGGMDRDDILLHNFSLGIALAGTYLRDSFPRYVSHLNIESTPPPRIYQIKYHTA